MDVSYHKRTAKSPRREAGQAGRGVEAMTIQSNGYSTQNMQAMQQARNAYASQAKSAQGTGTFKSQEIQGNDPNARAQAGQAFMNRNPSPDPKEGVVLQLSQSGRDLAEKLTQQSQAKNLVNNEDGRVTQVQARENRQVQTAQAEPKESTHEKIRERQQAKADEINPATQPKTATEAVKAQEDKRAEVKAEDKKEDTKAEANTTYEKIRERQQAKEDEMNPATQPKTATEAVKAQEEKRTETQESAPAQGQQTGQAQPARTAQAAPELAPEAQAETAAQAQQAQAANRAPEQQARQAQQASIANAVGTDALRVA
ncbi:MAG: hypothetical protein IJQ26_05795 [Lachnospiraceae bacterium]|nr:hypothetical protein [Lachnospiraceae bacterium]